jgi:hypothetical protein
MFKSARPPPFSMTIRAGSTRASTSAHDGAVFSPMFDHGFAGFPGSVVPLVVGIVGVLIGVFWIRRIARVEEHASFRATARPARDYMPIVAILVVVVLLATVYWLVFGR